MNQKPVDQARRILQLYQRPKSEEGPGVTKNEEKWMACLLYYTCLQMLSASSQTNYMTEEVMLVEILLGLSYDVQK